MVNRKEESFMLIGEYSHTIDAKGRMIVPAKFRTELGERFIVTKGFDGCLYGYSLEEWKSIEEKIKTLPLITGKDARNFTRFFFSSAIECELDSQGRILITPNLCQYASLEKSVKVIGVGDRIEIWDEELWNEENSAENTQDITNVLIKLGF